MNVVFQDELENSLQLSSQSIVKANSYVYNQMLKINNGVKTYALSSILINQNNEPENLMISELTYRSLSNEVDSRLIQEFQSRRHIIEPHQIQIRQPSPFQVNKQTCQICLNELNNIIIIEQCNHQFCQKCTTLYLYNKIISGEVQKITCPQFGCCTVLSELLIKQNINQEVYLKYQRFLLIKQYEHVVNGKWCPRPDCFNFVFQQGQEKILQCNCGQQFCFDCGNPNHPNKTCQESVDQVFAQALQDYKIQKCPNCKANILKNGGCNHMTCTKCHYDFCWLCGCRYTSIHYDWMNPCNCPGEQYQERDPYAYPKVLIFIRAILKLLIYVLLSPILALAGLGMIAYGIGYLLSKTCHLCRCLKRCCQSVCN
ncbi:unnamed protein product [Paramecium octaurelia]|uniref:RBR-type E3 ubiquitin transferase n=1 Tax=Paramecium octaurelia TaxID=43137 RepID=A0A8S1SD36_PAROT|nr:unnamed protein product [Paramecium octaurelia]